PHSTEAHTDLLIAIVSSEGANLRHAFDSSFAPPADAGRRRAGPSGQERPQRIGRRPDCATPTALRILADMHTHGAPGALDFAQRPLLVFWETTRACALACRHCRASAL